MLRYYSGCQRTWSYWNERYPQYNEGLSTVINDTGPAFWGEGATEGPAVCAKDKVTRGVDVSQTNQTVK